MPKIDPIKVQGEAERLLSNASPRPFSQKGFARLRAGVDDFIDGITAESLRIASRVDADTVSEGHVETAIRNLIAQRSRSVYRHIGTIGGLILGTGIQQFVAMVSDGGTITKNGVGISATFGIVGSFLVALHMAKE